MRNRNLQGVKNTLTIAMKELNNQEVTDACHSLLRALTGADVFAADEMFLTGSGAGVVGVRSLDGRRVGSGARGPVTAKVEAAHRQLAETEGDAVL